MFLSDLSELSDLSDRSDLSDLSDLSDKKFDFSKKGIKKHTGVFAGVQNLNLIMAKKGVKKHTSFFNSVLFSAVNNFENQSFLSC